VVDFVPLLEEDYTDPSMSRWNTRLTKQFSDSCTLPIIGAPMAGCAGGALAAAVCRSGGLGFIGAGHWMDSDAGMEKLSAEIKIFRGHTTQIQTPLCLGFIGHSTFRKLENWGRLEKVLKDHQPSVVQFFAPALSISPSGFTSEENNVTLCQNYNANVIAQVGTVKDAIEAVRWGVDGLMVQGSEAGGHGLRSEMGNATLPLVTTVIDEVRKINQDIPITAAGGVADGRTMAAFMSAGCDGVVMGSRLWCSNEALGLERHKDLLISSSCDDVSRTTVFDWIQNSYSTTPWPEPFDSVSALRNKTSQQWQGREHELKDLLDSKSDDAQTLTNAFKSACSDGDAEVGVILAGQCVGLIHSREPASDLVTRISEEAAAIIRNTPKTLFC